MSADIVQAQYEQLEQLAARFAAAAETQQALLQRVNQRVDVLRQGGWQGKGVAAFLREMDGEVGPAVGRLIGAFELASSDTERIRQTIMVAEMTAGRLFDSNAVANIPNNIDGVGNPDFDGVKGATDAEYTIISGKPFIIGDGDSGLVHPNDVTQGQLGDCYFVAAMAAVAKSHPEHLRNMIKDNGDGTFTVTLYERRQFWEIWKPEFNKVHIRVDSEFPARGGVPIFAKPGDSDKQGQELWPMLIEKAYAQHNGGYKEIVGGWTADAFESMVGKPSKSFRPSELTIRQLASYMSDGSAIAAESHPADVHQSDIIVSNHAYYIVAVDEHKGTVTVRNPWGWTYDEITLSVDDFNATFQNVSVNKI